MSTYESEEFEELKKLVQENHKILKSLQKKARLSVAFTTIRWSIVIAISIGLFTILQPIFQNVMDAYHVMMQNFAAFNDAKNSVSGVIDVSEVINFFGKAK